MVAWLWIQGKVTKYPGLPPSWECSLLGTSAGSGAQGRHESEGEGWSFRGKKYWDTSPWVLAQAHSPLIYSSGSQHSLRFWLPKEPVLGMKKYCHLMDISCNYNLISRAHCHLQVRPGELLMTAALGKVPGVGTTEINSKNNWPSRRQLQHINIPHTL